uniref:Putative secreted protein n=1 Tax=Amblyomma cajennense TaxID=34607 RepID=A0A023FDD0_AMBCJ
MLPVLHSNLRSRRSQLQLVAPVCAAFHPAVLNAGEQSKKTTSCSRRARKTFTTQRPAFVVVDDERCEREAKRHLMSHLNPESTCRGNSNNNNQRCVHF